MRNINIVPTVMPESYDDFVDKIKKVQRFVDWIQIDVMDGKFVPSKSWPYNSPKDSHWQDLFDQVDGLPSWKKNDFEIDLMVADQLGEAENWINAGVSRIIGHIEAFKKKGQIADFIALGRSRGVEVFLALAPDTKNSVLDPWLSQIDGVQFMGIKKVGYQGQDFAQITLEKISELRNAWPNLPIGVDGGVSFETARLLAIAGANNLASGSVIFTSDTPKKTIAELKRTATGSHV